MDDSRTKTFGLSFLPFARVDDSKAFRSLSIDAEPILNVLLIRSKDKLYQPWWLTAGRKGEGPLA